MSEECRSCGAGIDWAQPLDPVKKAQPVDHDSAGKPGGKLAVWRDGQGVLRFRYVSAKSPLKPGEKLGTSHWGTCKHADQWRGRSRTNPAASGHAGTAGNDPGRWPAGSNGEAANRS